MNRLKQAWLVLTGKAQALNISVETSQSIATSAIRHGVSVEGHLTDLVGMQNSLLDQVVADREAEDSAVVAEAESLLKGAK